MQHDVEGRSYGVLGGLGPGGGGLGGGPEVEEGWRRRPYACARPLAEEGAQMLQVASPSRSATTSTHRGSRTLNVVSLNLGGRNTNPFEFELKGDRSETAVQAMAMLRRAGKALQEVRDGPASLPKPVRTQIYEILNEIYQNPSGMHKSHGLIQGLFQGQTWMLVLSLVKERQPHLFNALNLSTLKLRRPSVWEDPASCSAFSSFREYLLAWQAWYRQLDRTSQFWLEDAPRSTAKRDMDVPTGFAGLLVFDVMCMCTARSSVPGNLDAFGTDHEVPFGEIDRFTSQLPASSLEARHSVAERLIEGVGAHVIFAQEARNLADNPRIADAFLQPFCAIDGFTAVFLRKGEFLKTQDISGSVSKRMEAVVALDFPEPARKAWRTTASRLAAVHCHFRPELGGHSACLVSLHCSHSDCTGTFLESLRDVLAQYEADLHVVGMDSNCSGPEAAAFQRTLRGAGFDIGPQHDQVTVAKQRTYFQTQIKKAGETDISHKDYVVSWGSTRLRRLETVYTPDLRTAYGVEQETKQCVRLPTISWPFDHCGVVTSFKLNRRCTGAWILRPKVLCSGALLWLVLAALLLPHAKFTRASQYGEPGGWLPESWPGTPRVGLCEGDLPCEDDWIQNRSSCYKATPSLPYDKADQFCQDVGSNLVSIGSEVENQFLIDSLCPEGSFCWIGLRSDFLRERIWWVSGEPLNYSRLGAKVRVLPFIPLSRDTTGEVTVLSAMPAEITGCRAMESLVSDEALPEDLIWLRVVLAGLSATVTAILLVLPKQNYVSTTKYLGVAFVVNFAWYLCTVYNHCITSNRGNYAFFVMLLDHVGHAVTSTWAYWIILRRMSVLYPARFQRIIFWLLVAAMIACVPLFTLFVDTYTTMDPSSPVVIVALFMIALISVLYLLFCVPIAADLYRTWVFMKQEANRGCSNEGSTLLDYQVRASQLHFFSVLSAIITGSLRYAAVMAWLGAATQTHFIFWTRYARILTAVSDSIANDVCAYILAVLNMDDAVVRAKGITADVARRATMEVEQHHLAVGLLKAAPPSQEQLQHLALLEAKARAALDDQDHEPFLFFQSAVRVETARIHRLMRCVRIRAMTMPLRYQYLLSIPTVPGTPRQIVPRKYLGPPHVANANDYFEWLYNTADEAQQVLFNQVQQLVAKFNSTPWPSDLGFVSEQFPWTIWQGDAASASRRLQSEEVISPGDILFYTPSKLCACRLLGGSGWTRCFVLEEKNDSSVRIHCSGEEAEKEVSRNQLRKCRGGAVFVPGRKKGRSRCLEKIKSDYEGREEWPAAASLADICRCMIVLDDPYAMAVLVAYIRSRMHVVRMKNRFNEDSLEIIGAEELQSIFYAASEMTESGSSSGSDDGGHLEAQYRDISINVQLTTPSGVPFICEIQVTLSNLAILKHADTKLYTIRRMRLPQELRTSHVFTAVQQMPTDESLV